MFPLASFTRMAINREQERRTPRGFSPKPYSYHQEIEIEIESLTNMGQGVGRDNGWVVMTPFSFPESGPRSASIETIKAILRRISSRFYGHRPTESVLYVRFSKVWRLSVSTS